MNEEIIVECGWCGDNIKLPNGEGECPNCGEQINRGRC